jgi:hypothetical protein
MSTVNYWPTFRKIVIISYLGSSSRRRMPEGSNIPFNIICSALFCYCLHYKDKPVTLFKKKLFCFRNYSQHVHTHRVGQMPSLLREAGDTLLCIVLGKRGTFLTQHIFICVSNTETMFSESPILCTRLHSESFPNYKKSKCFWKPSTLHTSPFWELPQLQEKQMYSESPVLCTRLHSESFHNYKKSKCFLEAQYCAYISILRASPITRKANVFWKSSTVHTSPFWKLPVTRKANVFWKPDNVHTSPYWWLL